MELCTDSLRSSLSTPLSSVPVVLTVRLVRLLHESSHVAAPDTPPEFPLPDTKTKRHIFKLHTSRMSLADDVDLEELVMTKDDLSGADIKAVCTEAGLLALRERRMRVTKADFTTAREKVLYRKDENTVSGLCCSGKTQADSSACRLVSVRSGIEMMMRRRYACMESVVSVAARTGWWLLLARA